MRPIARFMDARSTAEGKFLSVSLSVLLVFSFLNVAMFTDLANADDETVFGEDTAIAAEANDGNEESEDPKGEEEADEQKPTTDPAPVEDDEVTDETTTPVDEEKANKPGNNDVAEKAENAKAKLALEVTNATLIYKGQKVVADTLEIPSDADLKFEVKADDGYKVEVVKFAGKDIAPVDGVYTIKAEDLVSEKLVVETQKVEAANDDDAPETEEAQPVSAPVAAALPQALNEDGVVVAENFDYELVIGETKIVECDVRHYYSHSWKSSDPSVATVSSNKDNWGRISGTQTITAVSPGETTISCGNTSFSVHVKGIDATSLSLDPAQAKTMVGKSVTLKAVVEPANATLTWTSSDPNVATVNSNGIVTARGIGTATITVSSANGKSASSEITVSRNTDNDTEQTAYYYLRVAGIDEKDSNGIFVPASWVYAGEATVKLPTPANEGLKIYDLDGTGVNEKAPTGFYNYAVKIGDEFYTYDKDGTKAPGTYTVKWDEASVAWGANDSHCWYVDKDSQGNWVMDGKANESFVTGKLTWHINGTIIPVVESKATVEFFVQQPGSDGYEKESNRWPELVTQGTPFASIEPTVDATKTVGGITYYFDGWYKEDKTTLVPVADYKITGNESFYGRYIPEISYRYVAETGGTVDPSSEKISSLSGEVPQGSTATANAGYTFLGWFDEGGQRVSESTKFVPAATAAGYTGGTYTAKFERIKPKLDVEGMNWIYNGQSRTLAATASNLLEGEKIQYRVANPLAGDQPLDYWSDTAPSFKDVADSATVKVRVVDAEGNEVIGPVEVTVQIDPATITVKAVNDSKAFGEDDPALTYTNGDAQNNEVPAFTGNVKRKDGEAVGKYAIGKGDLALADKDGFKASNYEIAFEGGEFEIYASDALALTVNGYDDAYDGANHTGSAVATLGAEVQYKPADAGDDAWTTDEPTVKDVGEATYDVRAVKTGYTTKTGTMTLKVTPAPVTVTVNNGTKFVGENDPAITGTVTGVVPGETLAVTYSRANTDEAAGIYRGVLTATVADNPNYTVTVVPGNFTILPATPTPGEPDGNDPTPGQPGTNPTNPVTPVTPPTVPTPTPTPTPTTPTPTETIADEETPMGAFDEPHCWVHWVMLIGIIITAIYGIVVVRRRLGLTDDIDDYEDQILGRTKDSETVPAHAASRQAL